MKQKSLSAEPPILGFLVPLRLVLPLPGYQVFEHRMFADEGLEQRLRLRFPLFV